MTTYTSPQDGTTLDTHISSENSSTNYSTNINISIGEETGIVNKYRGLIQFPGLTDGTISSSALISSAKLYLEISIDGASNAVTFNVYRSKRDVIISQCTWNIWKTGSNWATAGGFGADDCEQTAIGSVSYTASESVGTWKEFDLDVSAIQEIVNGTWTTPTLFLRSVTESNDLYAHNSSNAVTSTNRPYLVIEYILGGQVIIWSSE